ncbi:MAG: YjiG family protein [Phascolarctobacterium sp.]|nr:YjiG family protein [Phascolarctobacterium sp.]MBO5404223.1 YjiG family protein [Phascolarctobacterium sp.]MBQ3113978.1 YjiG family protein [Phascolarctobacterium sp.]MBR2139980.1 YjiG family protein [Phascolarctobacterium sp.]
MSNNQPQPAKKTNNPFDIFIIGARKGLNITLNNLVPNILMAYAVAEVLRILGVMKMVGEIFGPLMFVFGLPGEAVTVVLTAWLSSSASVGLAANMAANGILDARHVTILMPCFFLLGAQLQYMGRLLGVADVPKRYWPLLMSASLLNALCAMLVMNWFFA